MDFTYYQNKYEPIDGKWYFVKKLGSGAFGTVFEVERRDHTNMKAAVKIVSVPANSSEVESYREENYELDEQSISSYFYGFVEEFTKEIQLMSKVRGHGNVVTIEDYDVKEHTDEIGWDIFIRMELLTPMNKYFKDCPPETRDVIKLGIDICKALEVCQKYKITHRDIKPSNIFMSNNGDYKLGDFGVSRTLEKTSSGLSKKGTYTYMAPEVFRGEAYGSNVDIYSLGIVMYKLLNNNMEPFRTEKTHIDEENALWMRMKGEGIPALANADERLSEIVIKACSFNPKDRYESPSQMREELEAILHGKSEEKVVFVNDDKVELNASNKESRMSSKSIPENFEDIEDDKTVGIFDKVAGETQEADEDEKTVGIFDVPPTLAKEEDLEHKKAVEKKENVKHESPMRLFKDIDSYDYELKGMDRNNPNFVKPIKNSNKKSGYESAPVPDVNGSYFKKAENEEESSSSLFKDIDSYDYELKRLDRNKPNFVRPTKNSNKKSGYEAEPVSDVNGSFFKKVENEEESSSSLFKDIDSYDFELKRLDRNNPNFVKPTKNSNKKSGYESVPVSDVNGSFFKKAENEEESSSSLFKDIDSYDYELKGMDRKN